MTRTMLLEKVWDYHFDPQTNVIDVHISRLRQKIDRGFRGAADPHRARRRILPACDLIRLLETSTFRLTLIYLALFGGLGARPARLPLLSRTAVVMEQQTDDTIEAEITGLNEQYRSARPAGPAAGDRAAQRGQSAISPASIC